ncbi:MAG: hypothetical protein JNL01_02470 [Bdellovibrionales bacterium]|nr:hypothetical protein [Bdellovibrionales bacterium]
MNILILLAASLFSSVHAEESCYFSQTFSYNRSTASGEASVQAAKVTFDSELKFSMVPSNSCTSKGCSDKCFEVVKNRVSAAHKAFEARSGLRLTSGSQFSEVRGGAKKKGGKKGKEGLPVCFVPGTLIQKADGSQIAIERIQVGDKVIGKDGVINTVLEVKVREYNDMIYGLNGAEPFVTRSHPFWTKAGWKSMDPAQSVREVRLDVGALALGDELQTTDQKWSTLNQISMKKYDGVVYNLDTDGDDTFTAQGYTVHNR